MWNGCAQDAAASPAQASARAQWAAAALEQVRRESVYYNSAKSELESLGAMLPLSVSPFRRVGDLGYRGLRGAES